MSLFDMTLKNEWFVIFFETITYTVWTMTRLLYVKMELCIIYDAYAITGTIFWDHVLTQLPI